MLTWEDDLEVHALRKRGWSVSAIARHTGHDRKTVRKYGKGHMARVAREVPMFRAIIVQAGIKPQ